MVPEQIRYWERRGLKNRCLFFKIFNAIQCKRQAFIHEELSHEIGRYRWFVEYEAGSQAYQEQGKRIAQHGFETQDKAKNAAEEFSKKADAALETENDHEKAGDSRN